MNRKFNVNKFKLAVGNDTQEVIANKIGSTQSSISKIMSGKEEPSLVMLCAIADAYHVSLDWLTTDIDDKDSKLTYGDILSTIYSWEKKKIISVPALPITYHDGYQVLGPCSGIQLNDKIVARIINQIGKMRSAEFTEDDIKEQTNKRILEYTDIDYIEWSKEFEDYINKQESFNITPTNLDYLCKQYKKDIKNKGV